jgi:hypothetical protein
MQEHAVAARGAIATSEATSQASTPTRRPMATFLPAEPARLGMHHIAAD